MPLIYATRRNHTTLRILQCVVAVTILNVLLFPQVGPFWRKNRTGGESGNYLASESFFMALCNDRLLKLVLTTIVILSITTLCISTIELRDSRRGVPILSLNDFESSLVRLRLLFENALCLSWFIVVGVMVTRTWPRGINFTLDLVTLGLTVVEM